MALAASSYGSLAEVEVLAPHFLDGAGEFSVSTTPTEIEVETIVDRISGVLNTALAAAGFSVPLTTTTAVLACDGWVVNWSVTELRRTYPHRGIVDEEVAPGGDIYASARDFVAMYADAFKNLGETVSDAASSGLVFTGQNKHSERSDPDNTSYEQPKFRRGLFDA